MTFRFCDDLGADGFGWIVDEAMTPNWLRKAVTAVEQT